MDNLKEIIDTYIENSDELALEIDGDWGTGKTYSVKKIFKEFDEEFKGDKKREYIYLSVSGLQEKDIERQFYELIIANMPSDTKGIFAKSLTMIGNKVSDLNLSFKGVSLDLPIGLLAKTIESAIKKKYIYVIDDLERISGKDAMAHLFGFVSSVLQETYHSKAIVLTNEKAMDEESKSFFNKNREKVFNQVIRFKANTNKVIEELITNSFSGDKSSPDNIVEIVGESLLTVMTPEEALNLRTFKVFLTHLSVIRGEVQKLGIKEPTDEFWKEIVAVLFKILRLFRQKGVNDNIQILNMLSSSTMESLNQIELVDYVISGKTVNWGDFYNRFQMQQKLFNNEPSISTIINFRQYSESEVEKAQEKLSIVQKIPFENVNQAMELLVSVAFMKRKELWLLDEEAYTNIKDKVYEYLSNLNFDAYSDYMKIPQSIRMEMLSHEVAVEIDNIIKRVSGSTDTINGVVSMIESGSNSGDSSFGVLKDLGLDQTVFKALMNELNKGGNDAKKLDNILRYMYSYYFSFSDEQRLEYGNALVSLTDGSHTAYDKVMTFNIEEHLEQIDEANKKIGQPTFTYTKES